MRKIHSRSNAVIFGLLLAGVACPSVFGQRSVDPRNEMAIPLIGSIATELENLPVKDIREDLPAGKLDAPEEKRAQLSGKITASGGLKIKKVLHWYEDASPYGIDFEGRGTVSLELPKKLALGGEEKSEIKMHEDPYWVTILVKPALSSDPNELSYLFVGGATIAFVMKPSDSGLRMGTAFALNGDAVSGKMSDWFRIGMTFPLNENNEAAFPLSFSLRIDSEAEEWDLFLMNRLRYAGIHYGKAMKNISFRSTGHGLTRLSELAVSAENPLFEDLDSDGIEDAVELGLGFSSNENDRYALDELGEYTNLMHFMNLRKVYASRSAKELEQTLLEAVALEELGESRESLKAREIRPEQRRLKFTEEDYRSRSDLSKERMKDFGREQEDFSEEGPPIISVEEKEGER